ncbi:MAG: S9 family peptidase [Burkholderiales bacterium]|nr:S9 family peptidase [Opitutaceae bacterium]
MPSRITRYLFTLALCLLSSRGDVSGATPKVEDFFGPPYLTGAKISPDGSRLAGIATWKADASGLLLFDIATRKTSAIEGDDRLDIYQVFWRGNDRLLFSISKDKLYSDGLYSVAPDKLADHIPIRIYDAISLVGLPSARPDRAIIWVRGAALKRGEPGGLIEIGVNRSVRLGSMGGSTLRIFPSPDESTFGFDSDLDGEITFARIVRDGKATFLYWDAAKSAWEEPHDTLRELTPLARDPDPAFAWVVTHDAEKGSQIRRAHLSTGTLDAPLHEDPVFDLRDAHLIFSSDTRELIGLSYSRQRTFIRWFAPRFAQLQAALKEALPRDEDHWIMDWDDAKSRFVVKSVGPRQPGLYQVFDLETQTLIPIGKVRPEIVESSLRPASPITFTARDGLSLHGYLTVPADASKEKPAPLVVLVHGGPQARDEYLFDAEAQFLVSRGYAVLQPNYRGSSGYVWPPGSNDYESDFGAMRDDVIDATRAALRSELFDPARVAIMGGSFGGYVALACSVEEPELFRCAISVCGVFDWAEHVKSLRPPGYSKSPAYEIMVKRLGDPRKNQAAYEAISPLGRLDRLRIPMLVAHGKQDGIVSVRQSRQLARELKKRKLPHETFYRDLAGHGFYSAEDRIDFYQTVERFLAENLARRQPDAR